MSWIGAIANNVLRNIVYTDTPPNVVQEVRPEHYSNRHIHSREDGIVLYGPGDKSEKYEIVLHRPCTETLHQAYRCISSFSSLSWFVHLPVKLILKCFASLSLFRAESLEAAVDRFIIYKDKVPVLVQIVREVTFIRVCVCMQFAAYVFAEINIIKEFIHLNKKCLKLYEKLI